MTELETLEKELPKTFETETRLKMLNKLSSHYALTNVRKAQQLLAEMNELLHETFQPDYRLSFLLTSGFVENQLYNYILAEIHYKNALDLLEERADLQQQAEAFVDFAGVYVNLEKIESAGYYLERAKRVLRNFPSPNLQARIFCREGYINLLYYKKYGDAVESFLEAEKILTGQAPDLQPKDFYFQTLIYSGLGLVYERNDEREKSVKAILNAVNLCESLGMTTRLSWHYLNVGNAYLGLGDEKNAEFYFQKAISSPDDISQHTRASAYGNLGYLSLQKKEYEKALELLNRAESLHREKSNENWAQFATLDRWRGKLFAEKHKNKRALRYFDSAYENARKAGDYMEICAICKEISSFHAELGDYKSAYEHQILYEEFNEKYLEEIKQRKTLELEVRFEAEKKKQEAELLQLQATKLQLKALRAQMNPHFMHNALNSIQDYINLGDTTNASKFLAKFADLMRQSLDYSDLEIISLEKEIEFLQNYLELNKRLRFADKMEYKMEIDEEIEEDIFGVPTMIVQPYIENALEHGIRSRDKGFISVIFRMLDEDNLICIVEDNGIGRAEARRRREADEKYQNHRSKGTLITEDRLRILHNSPNKGVFVKTIDLVSEKTGAALGTKVEIQIPIVDLTVQ